MKISGLALASGTTAPTIRYYEAIGLLPRARRQEGRQRVYDHHDVERLTFIRRCREFGFGLDVVRELLAIGTDPKLPCDGARDLARQQWQTVRDKLLELQALERSIARFVTDCENACLGGPGPECNILGELRRPASGCCASTS